MKIIYYPNRAQLFFILFPVLASVLSIYYAILYAKEMMYLEMFITCFLILLLAFLNIFMYVTGKIKIVFDDNGITVTERRNDHFCSWNNLSYGYVWYAPFGHSYALLSRNQLDERIQGHIIKKAVWLMKMYSDEYVIIPVGYYTGDKKANQIKSLLKEKITNIKGM